ncbi:hypothetical protein TsFJ059_007415 [Trichoderma semiorbis]|uniref:Uncharacterized protein n=1 Tax=Trichoderma semiorbis TaxID=1491008 RepID=A0A9P8HCJ1_9HYPO|nr:hypothetical protein TsFJ059_007415 [Trichoderma semiorbis]
MVRCVVGLGPQKITRLPLARGAEAVDFSENPSSRTVGIYFGLIFFKWQTQDLQTSLCQRLDEIQHLKSDCDENLRDTGHDAYSAIEHVVTELLTIERGANNSFVEHERRRLGLMSRFSNKSREPKRMVWLNQLNQFVLQAKLGVACQQTSINMQQDSARVGITRCSSVSISDI